MWNLQTIISHKMIEYVELSEEHKGGTLPWRGARYFNFGIYEVCAVAVIVLALAIRVTLARMGWPVLDSDEGTMGLMGMHIAYHGETPIFFYGQSYMGAAEAYLAALLFHFFGVSTFTLRLGIIFLFTLFLINMYMLTSLLFSKKWAIATLLLLSLGSNAVLTRELVAVGGDAETLAAGTFILLLASWLALSADQENLRRSQRLLAYGGWGLAVGFGLWSHMLVAPFVLMGAIILVIFSRKEIFKREVLKYLSWPGLVVFISFVIGASPLIIYNITNPAQNSLVTLWGIHRASGIVQPPFFVLLPAQLAGAFQVSLPTATGASPLCSASDALIVSFASLHATQCTLVHTIWPLGAVTLWIIATWLTLQALRPYWRRSYRLERSAEERQFLVRQFARFSLLAISGITFILFALSPSSALFPVASSRYLIGLLVTTPALLWPLWSGINAVKPLALRVAHVTVAVRLARVSAIVRHGMLLLIGSSLLLATVSTFTGIFPSPPSPDVEHQNIFTTQEIDQHLDVPATRVLDRQENSLIRHLIGIKALHIYSDYWTCDRMIFQTKEHIICSVVDADSTIVPGQNRYEPYVQSVAKDPYAAYVFKDKTVLADLMAQRAKVSSMVYKHYLFNGYVVYRPTSTYRLPRRQVQRA